MFVRVDATTLVNVARLTHLRVRRHNAGWQVVGYVAGTDRRWTLSEHDTMLEAQAAASVLAAKAEQT